MGDVMGLIVDDVMIFNVWDTEHHLVHKNTIVRVNTIMFCSHGYQYKIDVLYNIATVSSRASWYNQHSYPAER